MGPLLGAEDDLSDLMEFIEPEQLLAYVLVEDDSAIYVAKGQEALVAKALNAQIEGEYWQLQEAGKKRKRKRKEAKFSDWFPPVLHVKWTYLKGLTCKTLAAGAWIPIRNKRGKFIRSYQTPTKADWCVLEKGKLCKILFKKIEDGTFYTGPKGTGRKKIETRTLSGCAP